MAKALSIFRSQAWLARKLGVSQQRVSKLIQHDEWEWPARDWTDAEVAEITAWIEERRDEANAGASAPARVTPEALGFDNMADYQRWKKKMLVKLGG